MFCFEEQNRRQRDRHMDRIIVWLVPVAQQKHVSQSVCLSHGDFDSRFAKRAGSKTFSTAIRPRT